MVTRYNAEAQPAYTEFTATQNSMLDLPLQDQLQFMDVGIDDVAMYAIVPTLCMIGYMVKRHQYKNACKLAKQASAELAEMEK